MACCPPTALSNAIDRKSCRAGVSCACCCCWCRCNCCYCLSCSAAITAHQVPCPIHSSTVALRPYERPRPRPALAVPLSSNTRWPKASAPTRGHRLAPPRWRLCRGALLRAWHMIATWTVRARFFFQNPRRKRLTRCPSEAPDTLTRQVPLRTHPYHHCRSSVLLRATCCNIAPCPALDLPAPFAAGLLAPPRPDSRLHWRDHWS
jgi:hypothetical protein